MTSSSAGPCTAPAISLVVCTFNRQRDLADLLETALDQHTGGVPYEVIVVDNNSSDGTAEVVRAFGARAPERLVALFEPRPGKSHALETGLAAVRAPLFAIVDDDLLLATDYVTTVLEAFRQHPEIAFLGPAVEPHWEVAPPAWLTPSFYNVLALTNLGDQPIVVSQARPLTLLAGVFRTEAVRRLGGYNRALGVAPGVVGGTEDADLLFRLCAAGLEGRFWPALRIRHKVPAQRLTTAYFRRWHWGHGTDYARMRQPRFEASRWRPFGIPGHVLRSTLRQAGAWLAARATRRVAEALAAEFRLHFDLGFMRERLRDPGSRPRDAAKPHDLPKAAGPRPEDSRLEAGSVPITSQRGESNPMSTSPSQAPALSLLICTFNRQRDLADLLQTALDQHTGGVPYEVIVVDNNSSDGTAEVVRAFGARAPERLVALFEPRPGKSHALETGLAAVRAPLFAIVDDDHLLAPDYVTTVLEGFRQHPEIAFLGPAVEPHWEVAPPAWLTPSFYNVLALTNLGDQPIVVSQARPLTLLAGVFRTEAVRRLGGYNRALGVAPGVVGGTEDADLLFRLCAAGLEGRFWPALRIRHKVSAQRLTTAYFRRWHWGHGVDYARMRLPRFEASRWRPLGIPGHVLRSALRQAGAWLAARATRRVAEALAAEFRLRFDLGFIRERLRHARVRQSPA